MVVEISVIEAGREGFNVMSLAIYCRTQVKSIRPYRA